MFTNFQRKNMMSRGGRKDYRRWPADGGQQYKAFDEKERYDRGQRCFQQQSFRNQTDYRYPQEHRYNYDQNVRYHHDQYRQHPPLQSRDYDTSYGPRQRSYHDNKENKNHPNYTRYSPNKKVSHDRSWGSSDRRRSHSPPKFTRKFRSRSPVSSHARKKRRIKEKRENSRSPSIKSVSTDKGNICQNEKKKLDEAHQGEKDYSVNHRKSKRAPVTGRFQYKKKYFNNCYISNKKRFTWVRNGYKKHGNGNGVTTEKKLTIPPISSDEFSQRSEEVASEDDINENSDLEEGEICTDGNEMKRTKEEQKRKHSGKCNIERERKSKRDITETKPDVEPSSSNDEYRQEHLQKTSVKETVRKERHSYDEDTCNFLNRVTSDKISSTRACKDANCIKTEEANLTKKKDTIASDGECPVSSEIAKEEKQTPNSCHEEITNSGKVTEDNESITTCKTKALKQAKRESVESRTVMEIGEEISTCVSGDGICKDTSKSTSIKPSTNIKKSNETSGLKGKIVNNLDRSSMLSTSSAPLRKNNFELNISKLTKAVQNVDNNIYQETESFEEKVKGDRKENVVPNNKNLNEMFVSKEQNDSKCEILSSSLGKPNGLGVMTTSIELKKTGLGKEEREISESFGERPVTPPPYSSQSCKQNKGYYFSDGPSITKGRENVCQSNLVNVLAAQGEAKENRGPGENLRKISTDKYNNGNSSLSSSNLDKPWKNKETTEKDKRTFNYSSSFSNDGCEATNEVLFKKRIKQTTNIESSQEQSRKRHRSESLTPAVIKGRKNRPSDGVFYQLGKPSDKRRKIEKTHPIEQSCEIPKTNIIQKQKSIEIKSVQKVNIVPTQEPENKCLGKLEAVSSVKTSLFNKNKRRISHFESNKTKQSEHLKLLNEVEKDISDVTNIDKVQACESSRDNIFQIMKGLKSMKDTENGFHLNVKSSLANEKDVKNKIVGKGLNLKGKFHTDKKEVKDSKQTLMEENNENIIETENINESQGIDQEKTVVNDVMKDIIASIVSKETQMLTNDNSKTLNDTSNQIVVCNIDEVNVTKIPSSKENIPSNKENLDKTTHKGKQNRNISDFGKNDNGLHGHIKKDKTELETGRIKVLKDSHDLNGSKTRKAHCDETKIDTKTKETGSNLNEHNQKVNENESESEDDMDDIEPIEMIGSAFINDFIENDNATENSLINNCDFQVSENEFKIDYCDDSILLKSTRSDNIPDDAKMLKGDKENEYKNDDQSGKKCGKSNNKDGVCEENHCQIDNARVSKMDIERNTKKEHVLQTENLIKSPGRRFINTERKRFSAQLETLGKKMIEHNDTLEKIKTKSTNEIKESKLDKETMQTRPENIACTKSTEWLKLAKTNMQSLVKVKTQKQIESSTQEKADTHEDDLPSARTLLQWDTPQQTILSSELATNEIPQFSSSITSSSQSVPVSNTSVSQTNLNQVKSKVTSETSHGSSNQETQLTATCTINGMRMSISATTNNYANGGSLCGQTDRNSFNWTPSHVLDTAQINNDKSPRTRSLLSNKIIAEDLSPVCSSADQEPENSVSTAKAGTRNLHSKKQQEHHKRFSPKDTVEHLIQDVTQQTYQTGKKQGSQLVLNSNLHQPQLLDPHSLKSAFNRHEQIPSYQNDQHGVRDLPLKQGMACSQMVEQSYQENVHHNTTRSNIKDKNIAAFSTNVANVPMFNQLTAPLMDGNDSRYIYQGSSDKRYQAYADTSTTNSSMSTTPPVSSKKLQSNPVEVFGSQSIGNQSAVTGDTTTQYYSLACAQFEMPGVREPLRPSTCALTSQQTTRPEENHSPADAQNFCSQLIAEVAKEEKRRKLYRELCDLDGINTGDCGLDILLLSRKSYVRGLELFNKEVLHLEKEKRANNTQQKQQRSQTQTLQSTKGNRNLEERIHYLGNLKQNQR